MNYEFKLYAHGSLGGQKTWGVEDSDNNYIEVFYGRKSNVPVQMIVEVKQFSSSAYCYYTYFRTKNVIDHDNRSGSYFALTLRLNLYYADIQNIYNLLDAAYNKFVVGKIVSVNGGFTKYSITDFSQVEDTLKTLEKEIRHYMLQFSCDSDFQSLNVFKKNGSSEPMPICLWECDTAAITNCVKNNSSISVSPLYPSKRERHAEQQISEEQLKIDAAKKQAQNDVEVARHENEVRIQSIRDKYKDVDKTIESLRQENEKAKKEIANLNQKCQNATKYKVNYEKVKKDLDGKNEILLHLKDCLSKLEERPKVFIDVRQGETVPQMQTTSKNKKKGLFITIIQGIPRLIYILVIIMLLVVLVLKNCENKEESKSKYVESTEVASNGNIEQNSTDTYQPTTDNVDNGQVYSSSLSKQYPNVRIDIGGISTSKPMRCGRMYAISIIGADGILNGDWVTRDFVVRGDSTIQAKHSGRCTISFCIDGDTLVTRTIEVL